MPPQTTQELISTAKELARWQGAVDSQLSAIDGHFKNLNGSVAAMQEKLNRLEVKLAVATTGGAIAGTLLSSLL